MFSYVAKSLLSKTLRTFLRKYLENIELESIDYGSSTSSSKNSRDSKTPGSGTGAGWGVRLSNVKLREGMELMKLPGKRKRLIIVTKKTKTKLENSLQSQDTTAEAQTTPGKKKDTENSYSIGADVSSCESEVDTNHQAPMTTNDGKSSVSVTFPNSVEENPLPQFTRLQNRERLISTDSEVYFSSTPSTPTQSANAICGASASFCLGNKVQIENQKYDKFANVLNDNSLSDENQKNICTPAVFVENGQFPKFAELGNNVGIVESPKAVGTTVVPPPLVVQDLNEERESGKLTENDDESEVDVDEEVEIEDDMSLVVGAGGIIGSLNIRLIEKELHVTVEDAHLILEAIPKEAVSQEEKDCQTNPESSRTTQSTKGGMDRTSSNLSANEPSTPSPETGANRITIGEKIKQKSILARYLSMIPHLFLRDCRISLILPDGSDHIEEDNSTTESCSDSYVFELGIDFLSVTTGDDFMDVFRFDDGNQASKPNTRKSNNTATSVIPDTDGASHRLSRSNVNNIFSRKRIRTGKGPEGGIWLKIHPPISHNIIAGMNEQIYQQFISCEPNWARPRFLKSSEEFFFRCSGIDLHARILVDVKEEIADEITASWSNEYDDYTIDSMLFGVDYVDPISLTRHQAEVEPVRSTFDAYSSEIQTIPFPSNFHSIARGSHQPNCATPHIPLHDCFDCWNSCLSIEKSSLPPMNDVMPLPGFVFYLSVIDPLEINVDRNHLDAIGYLKSLFTSGASSGRKSQQVYDDKQTSDEDDDVKSTSTIGPQEGYSTRNDMVHSEPRSENHFPSFMQPDNIYLSGLHMSKLVIRLHALRPYPYKDDGMRFRFWQLVAESIYFEEQQLDSEKVFISDVTFHVGKLDCRDFVGICEKNPILVGSDPYEMSHQREVDHTGILLPFTASRVLDVSPPTTLDNGLYGLYAIHFRVARRKQLKLSQSHILTTPETGFANLKIGLIDADIDSTMSNDVLLAIDEAKKILFGAVRKSKENDEPPKVEKAEGPTSEMNTTIRTAWLYEVATKGGFLSYRPRIKVEIPNTQVRVKNGLQGTSFETFLNGIGVKYGSPIFEQPNAPSLLRLCSLSESLRMHILLYLDNLDPLETLFNIKRRKSSMFLRSHAINKKLSKVAESLVENPVSSRVKGGRREALLNKLQSLDTDALETLVKMYTEVGTSNNGI